MEDTETPEDTPDEEPKKEEASPEADSNEVVPPKEELRTPSQKLKDENDALETELIRAQKIRNEALLAGTGGGSVEKVKETEDEKWAKKAKERYEGTGMDPTPDDTQTVFT